MKLLEFFVHNKNIRTGLIINRNLKYIKFYLYNNLLTY